VLKSYVIEVRVVAEDGTTFTPSRVTVESTGEPVAVVAHDRLRGERANAVHSDCPRTSHENGPIFRSSIAESTASLP
jgi:hypothetical protein